MDIIDDMNGSVPQFLKVGNLEGGGLKLFNAFPHGSLRFLIFCVAFVCAFFSRLPALCATVLA